MQLSQNVLLVFSILLLCIALALHQYKQATSTLATYTAPFIDPPENEGLEKNEQSYDVVLKPGYTFVQHEDHIGISLRPYLDAILDWNDYRDYVAYGVSRVDDTLLARIRSDPRVQYVQQSRKVGLEEPIERGEPFTTTDDYWRS